jgi:molybdopterin-containing oxidoreductase family membrane subunit
MDNANPVRVTGLFRDESKAAEAVKNIRQSAWKIADVHGPIPSEMISQALGVKKSPVGWFTLAGGIIGFITGYLLAVFTSLRWELMVSGKPIMAYIPFFIVGFEFTVLFSVFGNVVGLILTMQLPAYRDLPGYSTAASGEDFAVVVACTDAEKNSVQTFLADQGARTEIGH